MAENISGNQFKKIADGKKLKQSEIIQKKKKIDSFFQKKVIV